MGTGVRDYTELVVFQLCDEVRQTMRPLLRRPCFQSDLELRGQLRRSSERPCPVIAEGFSRYHPREIAKFVRDAKSSLSEIIEHMNRAVDQHFVTVAEARRVCLLCRRGRGAATAYIRYLETAEAPGVPRTRPRPKWPGR
jgi:four helix bundle protein